MQNSKLFSRFLDYLLEIKDYVDIYIYSRDQIGEAFPRKLADKIQDLGLRQDFDAVRSDRGHNWYAYGAVIKTGEVCFENVSTPKSKMEYEDSNVLMISTCWNEKYGNLEPVFIDKKSNKNLWFQDDHFRGLTFVVYHDGNFIESRAFDVSNDEGKLSKVHELQSISDVKVLNENVWGEKIIFPDVSEKQFIERLVTTNNYDSVVNILLNKVNSGIIQQDWVYSYYIGICIEFLKDSERGQKAFEKYSSLISSTAPIYKFMNKWNIERLYSKIILSNYLDRHQYEIRNISRNIQEDTERFTEYPVFVYWGQGFQDAPPIIQTIHKRLSKVVPKNALISLSENNIREYIEIPDVVNKIRDKSYANYSDYLRFAILAKYGGAWVDSTVFVRNDFYERLVEYNNQPSEYPMDGPITVMGSWFRVYKQSSHLGEKMLQATTLFWLQNFDKFPFYFFIDFLEQYYADFKIQQDKERDSFDTVRDSSFKIRDNLSKPFDEQWSGEVLQRQLVHKLNYKLTDWDNLNKEESLYSAIIEEKYPFN